MLEILLIVASVLFAAYLQLPVLVWTLFLGTIITLITALSSLSFITLSIIWFLFLFAALFANIAFLRIKFFSGPLIKFLAKRMPSISETEREAIESGSVWWEKDLFCGRPDWKKFLSIPKPNLTETEQSYIDNQVETLCHMLDDWKIVNDDRDLPKSVWDYLKKEKFFGLVIPKEYGGLGFSALAHSTIVVKIATRSISAAVNTMVPNSLGPAELVLHYGTKEQKDYYLPRLASGEEIPCFALTGPEAGSDAGSISDSGIVCEGEYQGKKVLGVRLSWDKRYITLAPIATVLGLAFRLYDPENLLGKNYDLGITLCLLPTAHPGVEIGNRHLPLHLAFMNGPTRGKDVFIPIDWIIGGVAMAGQGWRMLMECLSIGRSISLPALSTACGKVAFRRTGAYARVRRQFSAPLANFEGIEEALAQIGGLTYTMEACRLLTAGAVDLKVKPAIASAIAKYHMTEMARTAIANAMDVHAGHMIQMGPRNYLGHLHISIPISITVEGANILTRNLIIFGQGVIRCHPYILDEIELLADSENKVNIKKLDKLLLSHTGYLISNTVRTIWSGLTGAIFVRSPARGKLSIYYKQLGRMSCALAWLSDISLLVLGGTLKRRERISARLGDILSQLYLSSAILKYYKDHEKPASDLDYVQWGIQHCLYQIQVACDDLLYNYPLPWLGKFLRWCIFPLGTAYRKPSDKLSSKIVRKMLEPSEFRNRVTQYCYISSQDTDPTLQIENALNIAASIEPLWKKLQNAIKKDLVPRVGSFTERTNKAMQAGILNESEMTLLNQFDALYKDIIKVDEFSFDLNSVLTQ